MGDDIHRPTVFDEPPSGVVRTRSVGRTLGFRLASEPQTARIAAPGFVERVDLEPSRCGFRARVPNDIEGLPSVGDSLLLEVAASLVGGGAAWLTVPVTVAGVRRSGLVAFVELEIDGVVEERADRAREMTSEPAARLASR